MVEFDLSALISQQTVIWLSFLFFFSSLDYLFQRTVAYGISFKYFLGIQNWSLAKERDAHYDSLQCGVCPKGK